jgi:hypothetical protein
MIRNDGAGRTMLCSVDGVTVIKVSQDGAPARTQAPSEVQARVGRPREQAAA